MNRFRSFAAGMTACLLLSGCQSVYLHDEGLKTSTAKAHEALAGVTPLKPFDDQLANLEAFAKREDLAVAKYWVAARDAHFSGLLTTPEANLQREMEHYVDERLGILIGSGGLDADDAADLPEARDDAIETLATYQSMAASARRRYREARADQLGEGEPEEAEKDLECPALLKTDPAKIDQLRKVVGPEVVVPLDELLKSCRNARESEPAVEAVTAGLEASDGLLGEVARGLKEAEAETVISSSAWAQELERKIKEAKDFKDEQSGATKLSELRDDLRRLFEKGGAATELAGWDKADEIVNALLRAEICDAPEGDVDEDTRKKAECDKVTPDSVTGKAQAAWALLKAVALLQDAGAEQRRGANWLLAAKAIIAAEKADAALRLSERKAAAAVLRRRLDSLLGEAASLVAAKRWLTGPRPVREKSARLQDCWGSLKTPGRPRNANCAFAAYADSWNQGRLPAEVAAFRDEQIEREFAVRRARIAAGKQYALALAGATTLKEYGEGGIMPEAVAQLLIDLTTVGVIGLED